MADRCRKNNKVCDAEWIKYAVRRLQKLPYHSQEARELMRESTVRFEKKIRAKQDG